MRVLHIMASGERGGGADHLLGVLPELVRRGVECVVAAGDNGPLLAELRQRDLPVYAIEMMRSRLHANPLMLQIPLGLEDAFVGVIDFTTNENFYLTVRPQYRFIYFPKAIAGKTNHSNFEIRVELGKRK